MADIYYFNNMGMIYNQCPEAGTHKDTDGYFAGQK
jgi:hypothetical protein